MMVTFFFTEFIGNVITISFVRSKELNKLLGFFIYTFGK